MNAPHRALIVTDVMSPGGVDRYVVDLAVAARSAGHEVGLVVEKTSTSRIGQWGQALAIDVHPLCLYHRAHSSAAIENDARQLMDQVGPSVVHIACGIPWSCLKFREVALDMRIHTLFTEQYVPSNLDLDFATASRIERLYARCLRAIFVSRENREMLAKQIFFNRRRTTIVPNAVDVQSIARRCTPLRDCWEQKRMGNGCRVVSVARLAPEKGLDVLCRAVASLESPRRLRLQILGDGPDRTALTELCRDLRITHLVRFSGWCDNVVAELAKSDLFVLPSRHEGMPYALLEAMAAGVPIVASDTPGSREALDNGRVGTLFPVQDVQALAHHLAVFLENPDSCLKKAEAAREWVLAHHDVASCMDATLDLWQ